MPLALCPVSDRDCTHVVSHIVRACIDLCASITITLFPHSLNVDSSSLLFLTFMAVELVLDFLTAPGDL